jgi:hypothetical protein
MAANVPHPDKIEINAIVTKRLWSKDSGVILAKMVTYDSILCFTRVMSMRKKIEKLDVDMVRPMQLFKTCIDTKTPSLFVAVALLLL